VTGTQLYLAIGVPIVVNLTALGIIATLLMHHTSAMATSFRAEFGSRFDELGRRIGAVEADIAGMQGDLKEFFKTQVEFDRRLGRIEDKLTNLPPR
jgi:hypothetical protein